MIKPLKKTWNKAFKKLTFANSYMISASMKNKETFGPIKNMYTGKDLVLCGAGPSLNKYRKIEGAVHFALNRAILYEKVHFDYMIADDWDGINFIQDKIEQYDCQKFFGHQIGNYEREIPESFVIKCNAQRYYTDSFMVEDGFASSLVCDIDCRAIGNMANIAMSAMQILLFTNPKKIYIVACDASSGHYTQNGVSEERRKQHEKDLKLAVYGNRVISVWNDIKAFAKAFYPDTEIISVNPVGLKGIFKDIYQE